MCVSAKSHTPGNKYQGDNLSGLWPTPGSASRRTCPGVRCMVSFAVCAAQCCVTFLRMLVFRSAFRAGFAATATL
ncbi:hypothetical protein V5799_022588 [Amblyomma americanum]|uniref:Uncharacterized protein n=1 Tax=Amblyomma americanum TaxID=6943 RepID=A0AAQ4FM42_AMBAM